MEPDLAPTIEDLLRKYASGECNMKHELEKADYPTLMRLQTLLSGLLGAENIVQEKASRVNYILELLDAMSLPENAPVISSATAFFNEASGEDERGNATNPTITNPKMQEWENRVVSGVLPASNNHYVTVNQLLRNERVSDTKENTDAVRNFILDMLVEHVMPLDINGRVRPRYEWFCFGRKNGSSRTTLYIDPDAAEFIVDSLELPRALPDDKRHWLPVTGVLSECGLHPGKENIAHMKSVLVEMYESTHAITLNGRSTHAYEHMGYYAMNGQKLAGGNKIYTDPDLVSAYKKELVERVKRLRDINHYMLSPYDACKAIGVNYKSEDVVAMKQVFAKLQLQERTVDLAADGYVPAQHAVPVKEVIREVRDSGRDMLQIDRRALPALKDEISSMFERARFPKKHWEAPLDILPKLGNLRVTRRNVRDVLRWVRDHRAEEPIMVNGQPIKVGDVFYVFNGPKGEGMKIMPEAVEALKPFVEEAVAEVRSQSAGRG